MKRALALSASLLLLAAPLAAQAPQGPPKPGPEHKRLSYFEGKWTSEGDMKASPFGPAGKITSTDTCSWFEGGFFVKCESTGKTPMGQMKGLGLIGYNAEEKVYTYYGVDNMGMGDLSKGTVSGDTWTFTGESKMAGKKIRSRYTMKELSPTSYSFKWEMAEGDGPFNALLEGKTTKAK